PDDIRVGVSTAGVWASTDGGASWSIINEGMYNEYMPPEQKGLPIAQDIHRLARCAAYPEIVWCQHHNGVFRSEDRGHNWHEITAIRPSKFGFAVAAHPRDPDTAWFVPAVKDERRIPMDGKVVVARTRDGGRSFDVLRNGLPQRYAYDLVWRHALAIDASGERLALGSTSGGLWISEDCGDSWSAPPTVLNGPFPANELVCGFWMLQAKSRDEVLDWMKRAPFGDGAAIEIRQVFEAEDFGAELTPELREAEERLRAEAARRQ